MNSSRFAFKAVVLAACALVLLGPQAASAGGSPFSSVSSQAAPAGDAASTDRLIIKYRSGVAAAQANAPVAQRALLHRGAQDAAALLGLNLKLVRVGALDSHIMRLDRRLPHAEMQRLARDIMASDPTVEYAEPDRILQALATPNDTQYGQQWHYYEATATVTPLPVDLSQASGRFRPPVAS